MFAYIKIANKYAERGAKKDANYIYPRTHDRKRIIFIHADIVSESPDDPGFDPDRHIDFSQFGHGPDPVTRATPRAPVAPVAPMAAPTAPMVPMVAPTASTKRKEAAQEEPATKAGPSTSPSLLASTHGEQTN